MFKLADDNVTLSDGAKICRGFEVNSVHKEMVWNNLVEEAAKIPTYEAWAAERTRAEDEILTLREKDGQEVRLKNGRFNRKCIFDTETAYGTYRSAKSVIKKAYESGAEIKVGMGKTATEKSAVTPDERVKKAIRCVLKNYADCTPEVQDLVQEMCRGFVAPF